MKKVTLFLALTVVTAGTLFAQKKTTSSGIITFDATTPKDALPKAENKTAVALLDTKGGNVGFEAIIKGFNFENAMIQEHFNGEKWMDSEKFPKATFKGKITNLNEVAFDKDGSYKATVTGDLTLHGITKPLTAPATIVVKAGAISTTSEFTIKLADYSLGNAGGKLADEPKITVAADFK